MTWQDVRITSDRGTLRVSGSVDVVDVHIALRAHFIERRGVETPAGGQPTPPSRRVPRTTNADVVQLAIFWTQQLLVHPRTRPEMAARRRRWAEMAGEVRALTAGAKPDAAFPKNAAFWSAAHGLAIACDVERELGDDVPGGFDAVVGFFTEAIPDAIGGALTWLGDGVERGAKTAGRAVGGAARGALDELGLKELLVGAGVLAGAAIVVPAMSKRRSRRAGGGA